MKPKRLLFVFAHPDDETFTSGITICKYSDMGDTEISLICATRGEAGKTGNPPQCSKEELAFVREQELKRACSILGVDHIYFLGHMDGQLHLVDTQKLANQILKYIWDIHPQVVVTFPPHGISGHKDHLAIQAATWQAVTGSKNHSVQKLYYVVIPESAAKNSPRKLFSDPDDQVTTRIYGDIYIHKVALALMEHKTQNQSIQVVFPGIYEGDYRHIRGTNYFRLAWSSNPSLLLDRNEKETDLFDGIQ